MKEIIFIAGWNHEKKRKCENKILVNARFFLINRKTDLLKKHCNY